MNPEASLTHQPAFQPVSGALLEVQGLAHHPKCQTHSRGSTEQPWCSCGLAQALAKAGSKAER